MKHFGRLVMSSRSRLNAEQARGSLVRRLMPEKLCDEVFFTALRHATHATCSKHTLPPLHRQHCCGEAAEWEGELALTVLVDREVRCGCKLD